MHVYSQNGTADPLLILKITNSIEYGYDMGMDRKMKRSGRKLKYTLAISENYMN